MGESKRIIPSGCEAVGCNLMLVRKGCPVRFDEREMTGSLSPALYSYSDILLEKRCAFHFRRLLKDCGGEGRIIPVSGYRTREDQQRIFSGSMVENGEEYTLKFVAYPDDSEHQTGLAIDVGEKQDNIDFICPSFPYDGICQEFRSLAPKYGFIERYQRGKEHITGIAHEPWHFRYVGYPHSEIISRSNFTLEEYIDYLKAFSVDNRYKFLSYHGHMIEIYYQEYGSVQIPAAQGGNCRCEISDNNVDGFIITLWKRKE